jgi:hypothetical protein
MRSQWLSFEVPLNLWWLSFQVTLISQWLGFDVLFVLKICVTNITLCGFMSVTHTDGDMFIVFISLECTYGG